MQIIFFPPIFFRLLNNSIDQTLEGLINYIKKVTFRSKMSKEKRKRKETTMVDRRGTGRKEKRDKKEKERKKKRKKKEEKEDNVALSMDRRKDLFVEPSIESI